MPAFRFFALLLLMGLGSTSCDNRVILPYDFKDQNVSGKIEGDDWNFTDGFCRRSIFAEDTLSIQLSDQSFEPPCSFLISEQGVRFTVPATEGLFLLSSIPQSYQTVSIYNGSSEYLALGGAIEIILIDWENRTIEGRLDARYDGNNQVNGNFSLRICD